jgi:hypothetical protein
MVDVYKASIIGTRVSQFRRKANEFATTINAAEGREANSLLGKDKAQGCKTWNKLESHSTTIFKLRR